MRGGVHHDLLEGFLELFVPGGADVSDGGGDDLLDGAPGDGVGAEGAADLTLLSCSTDKIEYYVDKTANVAYYLEGLASLAASEGRR